MSAIFKIVGRQDLVEYFLPPANTLGDFRGKRVPSGDESNDGNNNLGGEEDDSKLHGDFIVLLCLFIYFCYVCFLKFFILKMFSKLVVVP